MNLQEIHCTIQSGDLQDIGKRNVTDRVDSMVDPEVIAQYVNWPTLTSALESLYGGQFTLPTQLIKPNYPAYMQMFGYFHLA